MKYVAEQDAYDKNTPQEEILFKIEKEVIVMPKDVINKEYDGSIRFTYKEEARDGVVMGLSSSGKLIVGMFLKS